MNIKIISVEFLPNGDIKVIYEQNGAVKQHTIPQKAVLRSPMDDLLIAKIKGQLVLP